MHINIMRTNDRPATGEETGTIEETTAGGHGEGVVGGVFVEVVDGGIDVGQACDRGSNRHDGGNHRGRPWRRDWW